MNFEDVEWDFPVTLVVGSEAQGIPAELVAQCDLTVAIPMFGLMGSLNVATATAIVVQRIASQYARQNGFEAIRDESRRLLSGDLRSR